MNGRSALGTMALLQDLNLHGRVRVMSNICGDLRQTLGLSPDLERHSDAIDLWDTVSRLLRDLLRNLRHKR